MDASIPAKIGKYEIVRKIGQGGFGVVYEGRDPFIRRRVAIKTCTVADAEVRRRFFREGEIAGNLTHRHVVTVFDLGEYEGSPYLVQEFLVGEDLSEKIKRRERLSDFTKLDYLIQVADGLEYAHARGVVHRDIKPHNIRILEDGQVKIMDFGIAKLASAETQLTQAGTTMGTAGYLPPEQIRGEAVDLRADIFSFGVMAYELLGSVRPFRGENLSAIFFAIIGKDPEPLSAHWPTCPPEVERIVHKCMAKEPAQRYASCTPLLADLRPLRDRLETSAPAFSETISDRDTLAMPAPPTPTGAEIETLRSLERRLRELVEHGDVTAAELELTLARKKYGESPTFTQLMSPLVARIADIRHQWEAERQRAERLAGLLDRARTHRTAQEFDEALVAIKAALDIDPANQEAQSLLRSLEAAVERQREARRRAEGARAAGVEVEDLIEQRQLDRAAERLAEALQRHGKIEPLPQLGPRIEQIRREQRAAAVRELLARSDALERDERLDEAVNVVREALAAMPNDVTLQRRLASVSAARQKQLEQQRRAEIVGALRTEVERLLASGDIKTAQARLRQGERDLGTHTFRELRDRANQLEVEAKEHERREREQEKTAAREAKKARSSSAAPAARGRVLPLAVAVVIGVGVVAGGAIAVWTLQRGRTAETTDAPTPSPSVDAGLPTPALAAPATTSTTAAPPTTLPAPAAVNGVLALDALPWAEVVEIVDQAGRRAPVPAPRYTPLLIELPAGEYTITLKNAQSGAQNRLKVKLGAGASERRVVTLAPIDASEYLRRVGL